MLHSVNQSYASFGSLMGWCPRKNEPILHTVQYSTCPTIRRYPDEEVSPEHSDVVSWEERQESLNSMTPTARAEYVAGSPEMWTKLDEGPPRMTRTNHGAFVRYDLKG